MQTKVGLVVAFFCALNSIKASDYTATIDPNLVLVDNFEGWGTSLCWWANLVGGYTNRSTYMDLAFNQLRLNLVRYNIGGGENPGISNTMEFRARMAGFEPSPGVWDWSADANQRWVLRAAVARGVNRVEAFANSPPYWMTVSGSVTGSTNGTSNNLQTNYESAFAIYLTTVLSNLTVLDGVSFESVTPLNEPTASWWKFGGRQEGCHIGADQQARLVNLLKPDLAGQTIGIAASEDNDEQSAINSINTYDAAARTNIMRVVSHTYGANNPGGLRNLAASLRRPLWVSEYGDGDSSGLTMARRIHDDLAVMWARGWVYWQFVDNGGGWGMLYNALDSTGNTSYSINKKFYVMEQFSQFVRPGCQILSMNDTNTLAAYDATNRTLFLIVVNETTNSFNVIYDLQNFSTRPAFVSRWRTSPSESFVSLAGSAISSNQFTSAIAPQSVTTHVLTNMLPSGPSSAPLAWYRLEGDALDATGSGNDGAISGNTSFVAGKLGALAAQFDGTNGYIQIPRTISNHFTISFWVKTTATGGGSQWWAGKGLVDGEVSGTVDDFGTALVGNKAAFGIGNPDTTIVSTSAINDGLWHHVAATRDAVSGQMQLFVDGALQAATNGPVGPKSAPPGLRLGSIQAGYAGGFLRDAIDDVQLFGRVFTAAEIPSLMNHPPVLAAIADASILAGRVLSATNSGTDPDTPAQSLTWSLASGPAGAAVNPTNGVLSWRPTIAQSPGTNTITVILSDNGVPAMSATQSFKVTVLQPASPQLVSSNSAPGFVFYVLGDMGPDYIIEVSTNLGNSLSWVPVATNSAPAVPFFWSDPGASNYAQRFYRVRLGP